MQGQNAALVNAQDKDGRTPLIVCTGASGQGALICMTTLIKHGADVDAQDNSGFTALHVAAIGEKNLIHFQPMKATDPYDNKKLSPKIKYFRNTV